MPINLRHLTALVASAGVAASLLLAPPAAALPACTDTGPTTRQCERPGNTAITTSPPDNAIFPYFSAYPFGLGIGIGPIFGGR